MRTAEEFLALSKKQLLAELRRGHPIDPESLVDTEYKGTSLGLPGFVERLTWKKFKKTFHRDEQLGVLRGWNVRLEQTPSTNPCIPLRKDGALVTFGHYHVVSPAGRRVPKGCDRGLLIDYGLGRKPLLRVHRSGAGPPRRHQPRRFQLGCSAGPIWISVYASARRAFSAWSTTVR